MTRVELVGGRSASAVHYQQCFIPSKLTMINISDIVKMSRLNTIFICQCLKADRVSYDPFQVVLTPQVAMNPLLQQSHMIFLLEFPASLLPRM